MRKTDRTVRHLKLIQSLLYAVVVSACTGSSTEASPPHHELEGAAIMEASITPSSAVVRVPSEQIRSMSGDRYLIVDLASISNRARDPVIIDVVRLSEQAKPQTIGSFSPFPPDSPGRYLVRLPATVIEDEVYELRLDVQRLTAAGSDLKISFALSVTQQ